MCFRENDGVRVVEAVPKDLDSWLDLAKEVEPLFGPMVDQPAFHQALLRNLGPFDCAVRPRGRWTSWSPALGRTLCLGAPTPLCHQVVGRDIQR